MKVPLEPIPKEPVMLASQSQDASAPVRSISDYMDGSGSSGREPLSAGQLDKAYPWLLAGSIALSMVLCWLYVTKPVIVEGEVSSESHSGILAADDSANASAHGVRTGHMAGGGAALLPSDRALPGADDAARQRRGPAPQKQDGSAAQTLRKISPAKLAKSRADADGAGFTLGWEATNLKVQHILSVDSGSDELEKIVLNVPVLYETRTMRWSPGDIAKARGVMRGLMEYERKLNELRNEGHAILQDWNQLLQSTSPTVALRADSPSLPYNHGQDSESETLPDSSSAIKLEQ